MPPSPATQPQRPSRLSAGGDYSPSLRLHELAFTGDLAALSRALKDGDPATKLPYNINGVDKFGNTALIIAVQRNHYPIVSCLHSHGALIKLKNRGQWSALSEAASMGQRDVIKLMWKTIKTRTKQEVDARLPDIMDKLSNIPDFHLVMEWKFSSWVPLLGRLLPADVYHIIKKGNKIRVETTLVDFDNLSWIRGDVAFIFSLSESAGSVSVVALDNENKVFANLGEQEQQQGGRQEEERRRLEEEEELEEEVDHIMSSPISELSNPGRLSFVRARSGVWGWRKDREEAIHQHTCRVFHVNNIILLSQKRFEHLSEDEKASRSQLSSMMARPKELEAKLKEKQEQDKLDKERKKEKKDQGADDADPVVHRASLPPPPTSPVSFDEYFRDNYYMARVTDVVDEEHAGQADGEGDNGSEAEQTEADDGHHEAEPVDDTSDRPAIPHLGRPMDLKVERKRYSATLWLTDSFPLSLSTIIQLLEMAAPHQRHVLKLKQFIERRLPAGFPMKLVLPVFPTVSATVTFLSYSQDERELPAHKFEIPKDYQEDKERFQRFKD